METTFKTRVCETIIRAAALYEQNFIDCEYLIYANQFKCNPYYIISAEIDNFLHLTGVNSRLSPKDFYYRSRSGKLDEKDFDFIKRNQNEKSAKGSVRRKIEILEDMMVIMQKDLYAQESFVKNAINCSLATSDSLITLGFVDAGTLRPKTLLSGDELSSSEKVHIIFIAKRKKGSKHFDDIVKDCKDNLITALMEGLRLKDLTSL